MMRAIVSIQLFFYVYASECFDCNYPTVIQFGRAFGEGNLHKTYFAFWWLRTTLNLCNIVSRKVATIDSKFYTAKTDQYCPCTSLLVRANHKRSWNHHCSYRKIVYISIHDAIDKRFSDPHLHGQLLVNYWS